MTYKIEITGKVQGVAFRYSAKTVADALGITGYAKNLYDGSVEIVANGDEIALQQFIQWCQQGPTRARIKNVDLTIISEKVFERFEVI